MSEIVDIDIIKDNEAQVSIVVRSFRDDALPNPDLKEAQDIATTGFVLFCSVLFYNYRKSSKKLLPELFQELKELRGIESEYELNDKYFKPETTNHFIKSAKIVEFRRNIGDDYSYSIENWVQQYHLTPEQRKQLFEYMDFDEDAGYTLEDDFPVELLGGYTHQIAQVIGEEHYRALQPLIHIQLKFNNPKLIERLQDLSGDSTLDSYISSWLPKET